VRPTITQKRYGDPLDGGDAGDPERVEQKGVRDQQTYPNTKEVVHRVFDLGCYLEDAEVYLEVLNKRAYILGEVNKPGEVRLFNEKLTLLQLLATAGDLKDGANRKSIVILQKRGDKIYTRTVDLTGLNSLKMANLIIHPNDVVYVPPRNTKVFNVGVQEATPVFGLAGSVLSPAASLKYLLDN